MFFTIFFILSVSPLIRKVDISVKSTVLKGNIMIFVAKTKIVFAYDTDDSTPPLIPDKKYLSIKLFISNVAFPINKGNIFVNNFLIF